LPSLDVDEEDASGVIFLILSIVSIIKFGAGPGVPDIYPINSAPPKSLL